MLRAALSAMRIARPGDFSGKRSAALRPSAFIPSFALALSLALGLAACTPQGDFPSSVEVCGEDAEQTRVAQERPASSEPASRGFSQQNDVAEAFLNTSPYDSTDYSTSFMEQFVPTGGQSWDDPAGCSLEIPGAVEAVVSDATAEGDASFRLEDGKGVVLNLIPGRSYRYRALDAAGRDVEEGELEPTGSLRMVALRSVSNMRDLGGWPCDGGTVAYGKMFRGAAVTTAESPAADEQDIATLRSLGIRHEIDLRNEKECLLEDADSSNDIISSALGEDVEYARYSVGMYAKGVRLGKGSDRLYAQALDDLFDHVIAGEPTYFHCAIGADRTGTLACLVEALLGVSQSDIDKDYELTSLCSARTRLRTRKEWVRLVEYLQSFGRPTLRDDVLAWADEAGVSREKINAFRAAAIEGAPEPL